MTCAVTLGSSIKFQYWLSQYVKNLVGSCNESQLWMLVEMLLSPSKGLCDLIWWSSSSPTILAFNRKNLVETVVLIILETSKNSCSLQRLTNDLQRLTNEVAPEVKTST
jgi:hypothetical protein